MIVCTENVFTLHTSWQWGPAASVRCPPRKDMVFEESVILWKNESNSSMTAGFPSPGCLPTLPLN